MAPQFFFKLSLKQSTYYECTAKVGGIYLLINANLPRLNHGTFPITCSFTLSSKNLLWFVIDSKTELIKLQFFKLNSTHLQIHNHQPCNDMTWSYWKHCFSKSSSPKVPFWTRLSILKSNNFEIKLFFDTEPCAAGQARLIQNFDRVTKKFTTKLRCIPHASVQWHALCPICEFFVLKLFEFKSQ